jgi:hypothetical protein
MPDDAPSAGTTAYPSIASGRTPAKEGAGQFPDYRRNLAIEEKLVERLSAWQAATYLDNFQIGTSQTCIVGYRIDLLIALT